MRKIWIGLAAASALALGGCAYGDYGYGLGYGGYYGDYGYYGGPYYDYAYGGPYFGWYDDYYYPGTGIYVYDSGRHARRWSSRERSYWTGRRAAMGTRTVTTNWSGFHQRHARM
jgi:hypothetical protein